jgi:DNA-binding winged helix-turn-helix (wHTH) protein
MKSDGSVLHFREFVLDPGNRTLTRAGLPVEIGGRYLDALILLASERGRLISKDRLHEEVWRGVPVTDEALSQAIMALRRALGDDAGKPRFIETVPRHGYRFIAEVGGALAAVQPADSSTDYSTLRLVGGGALGAGAAGAGVGLFYGSLAAGEGAGSAFSLVLVMICVSVLAALASGVGIAGGIGLLGSVHRPDWWRPVVGGALGGLALGGFARLLGLDALRLLVGKAPPAITGASEGLVMGMAVGAGLYFARRTTGPVGRFVAPVTLGASAGLAILALGGTLMAGSLLSLVASFPGAALTQAAAPQDGWMLLSGAFEGGLFAAGAVAGMQGWRR